MALDAMPSFYLFNGDGGGDEQPVDNTRSTSQPVAVRDPELAVDSSAARVDPTPNRESASKHQAWDRADKIGSWINASSDERSPADPWDRTAFSRDVNSAGQQGNLDTSHIHPRRRPHHNVVPGLPRPITFARQNSERREKLVPHELCTRERRALSADRRAPRTRPRSRARSSSPQKQPTPSASLPEMRILPSNRCASPDEMQSDTGRSAPPQLGQIGEDPDETDMPPPPPPPAPLSRSGSFDDIRSISDGIDDELFQEELDSRWILNLSMDFRDGSAREKFWVTYAEQPDHWRRVTITCDYRDIPEDSLEANLQSLPFKQDKSECIYEAIRDSLSKIHFYPTVTNLKLQTSEGHLHVHVTEDVNEIIEYPKVSAVAHLSVPKYRESEVRFDRHISGFVYRVEVMGQTLIKKEIPGPDSVEEFLYEINALCHLQQSSSVINICGLVVDDAETVIKGVLITYAEKGPLVDVLYDAKGSLPWHKRERWAKQIVQGLSDLHEAGFVQGDFTLSNIVVDANDDAKIIDINRRGCPMGWEPPEIKDLVRSGQKVAIYIGVKSDIFQLGMVLWALAFQIDEPERQQRPLTPFDASPEVPVYFRGVIHICLSEAPKDRPSARSALASFPDIVEDPQVRFTKSSPQSTSYRRTDTHYIDPNTAVELEDIHPYRERRTQFDTSDFSTGELTFAEEQASADEVKHDSGFNFIQRGRSPPSGYRKRYHSPPHTRESSPPSLGEARTDRKPSKSSGSLDRKLGLSTSEAATKRRQPSPTGPTEFTCMSMEDTRSAAPVPSLPRGESSFASESSGGRTITTDRPGALADTPPLSAVQRSPHSRFATFHDRMLEMDSINANKFRGIQNMAEDTPASMASLDRANGSFSPPQHQDSGFDEETGPVEMSRAKRQSNPFADHKIDMDHAHAFSPPQPRTEADANDPPRTSQADIYQKQIAAVDDQTLGEPPPYSQVPLMNSDLPVFATTFHDTMDTPERPRAPVNHSEPPTITPSSVVSTPTPQPSGSPLRDEDDDGVPPPCPTPPQFGVLEETCGNGTSIRARRLGSAEFVKRPVA